MLYIPILMKQFKNWIIPYTYTQYVQCQTYHKATFDVEHNNQCSIFDVQNIIIHEYEYIPFLKRTRHGSTKARPPESGSQCFSNNHRIVDEYPYEKALFSQTISGAANTLCT